ncbi:MAG: glycosyltransferase family 2 protein [Legionellaceae bacterium]
MMLKSNVIIFMGTHDGAPYLKEQLRSLSTQTFTNWELWISDDASTDRTQAIIHEYQQANPHHPIFFEQGPNRGFAANFLSLACNSKAQATYYAFADQDDIWEADKLKRAIDWLQTAPHDQPALYCSRTQLIDEQGKNIGYSPLFCKAPGFKNALIQNIGGGNTMVFNQATINLLRSAGMDCDIIAHDWWTYMLVTGAGGMVYYDKEPSLRYRQHAVNLIGSNIGWRAKLKRMSLLFQGRFDTWNNVNTQALFINKELLTQENQAILTAFISARQYTSLLRMFKIKQLGLYRQTFLGNLALSLAALCNKF